MVIGTADASQLYRFKDIETVPNAKDLINIVLSRTQRKTPTVVHPQYDIRRIRSFYMRKVKFCQQTFHDKLVGFLKQFPRLDDIHPFYADLCNILYDRDHYKIALGQVNSVNKIVDNLAKEYVRLLKYADSSYKCKMLKRSSLGRMCKCVLKLNNSLVYLEEIRLNLSRLPSINPYNNTLLLIGLPNVGKSSFMNIISNNNIEVGEWAFTTRSLYLGHFNYNYAKWQIIDTPGILDRPLHMRNSVELLSINALAHLSACIMFLLDVSEAGGYTIEEQVKLFHSLKPLLVEKPVVCVLNKIDLRPLENLEDVEKGILKTMEDISGGGCVIKFITASALEKIGVDEAKNMACELLSTMKAQKKMLNGGTLNKIGVAGMYITEVKPSDARPPTLPPNRRRDTSTTDNQMVDVDTVVTRVLEKDLMEAHGGPGVYVYDERKTWELDDPEWKYDQVPEFFDGKNILDYLDKDIEQLILDLEQEDAEIEAHWNANNDAPTNEWYEAQQALKVVAMERKQKILHSSLRRGHRKFGEMAQEGLKRNALARPMHRVVKQTTKKMITLGGRAEAGLGNAESRASAVRLKMLSDRRYVKPTKGNSRKDQVNESDRFIGTAKPKHLYSGKRGIGKTNRR